MSRHAYGVPLRVLAGVVAFGLASNAAASGLQPAAPDEIVSGAKACAGATSAAGVDRGKLESAGWHHATATADDKPVDAVFYGKGDLLLTLSGASAKICFITARIRDTAAFLDVGHAMDQGLAVSGASKLEEANTVYWFPPDHIVQMKLTGKPDAPAVRIAVGYNPSEKQ